MLLGYLQSLKDVSYKSRGFAPELATRSQRPKGCMHVARQLAKESKPWACRCCVRPGLLSFAEVGADRCISVSCHCRRVHTEARGAERSGGFSREFSSLFWQFVSGPCLGASELDHSSMVTAFFSEKSLRSQ